MPTERYSVPQHQCSKCHLPMHPSKKEGEICEKCQGKEAEVPTREEVPETPQT
jgi:Zn finger protein HypA/HybF involved in hydrogenase expression